MRQSRATNLRPRGATRETRLRVLSGPDAGREISLPIVGVVLGADSSADVVLTDPAVSGRHVAIAPAEAGFRVEDLGSRNGTVVDGVTIARAVVPLGTVLGVGRSLIQLVPAEEALQLEPSAADRFGQLIGASPPMRQVYALLERASQSDAAVLLLGESGTGKELAARALHSSGPRRDGPFVVFDCGAASETLMASDLFGHVRGAFTGAAGDRVGAFAAAHGGTLFLDEIGDLPLSMQPKLLRMLETGEVAPLGGHAAIRFDVRIVAATHVDLWQEVAAGGFRGDLYYRLAVVEAQLPPLRQRRDDIPELARLFLRRAGADAAADGDVSGANLERLLTHHWPGNVRELRNVITRAVALAAPGASFGEMPVLLRSGSAGANGDGSIEDVLAHSFGAARAFHQAKAELVERFERSYLRDLLARADANISRAARLAGLERKYLYRLLDRHELRRR